MTAVQNSIIPGRSSWRWTTSWRSTKRAPFAASAKVELIEGELLTMSPQHHPHVYAKSQLAFRLHGA